LIETGIDRYYGNLRDMLGYEPSFWWRMTWVYTTPFICFSVFLYSLYDYEPLKYGLHYVYPWWGQALGWFLALSSMLCIPGYAIWLYHVTPGTFAEVSLVIEVVISFLTCFFLLQRMKKICRPEIPEIEAQVQARKEKELGLTTITPV
jgi:hypothetical protein